jgi:hypothetical protein
MTDCIAPYNDKWFACTKATGIINIPGAPTTENLANRTIVCATPACQELFNVFRGLVASECKEAVDLRDLIKNGMYSLDWCPTTKAPTTTKPPTTTTIAPRPTTVAPVTRAPTTERVVTPAPTPSPTPITSSSGISTGAIGGIIGGVLVVVLLVINIILHVRRKRRDKLTHAGYVYSDMSNAPTDSAQSAPDLLQGGVALTTMRIPYEDLQFRDVVSHGGFGEVLLGMYKNNVVAIKRLLGARRKDAHSIRSFRNEIELTASLDHECIVKFIGVAWDVPANLCMVSEFMHGGDLRSLLVRYGRDGHAHGHEDGKLRIAVQVAHAMTYLHSLETPVVHRDLKSRNVLLTESMDAKIIDFGISCERQDVTMTAGVGTSLWMAPEVMLGKRYDEKADVFSFGVILSELDTHELPYDHAIDPVSNRKLADMVLMQLVCDGQLKPRFTEFADPEMVSLASECLEVDPTKRPLASQVLYRIHRSRQHDRTLTAETRSAMESSLHTAETRTNTRHGA